MLQKLEQIVTPPAAVRDVVTPVFRILTSLIFVIGGLGHFGQHTEMLERISESPWRGMVARIGDPSMLLWLSGAAFVVAGITLAAGWMTRISSIVLFVTLVPITLAIHLAPGHVGPLFKNIAILGALTYFWANGAGAFSLERFRKSRQ